MNAPGSPSSALQITYFVRAGCLGDGRPLQAGRVAGTAAAAQPAACHLVDDIGRLHRRQRRRSAPATRRGRGSRRCSRGRCAPEFSSTTFSWRAKNGGDGALTGRRLAGELVDDGGDGCRGHPFEQATALGNVDERPARAQAEAPDPAHGDVGQPAADDDLGAKRVDDACPRTSQAAGRLADVGADPHGALPGTTPCAAGAARAGARAVGPGRRPRSQAGHLGNDALGAEPAVDLAVDDDDRSDAAGSHAVGDEDGDVAVARRLPARPRGRPDAVEELRRTVDVSRPSPCTRHTCGRRGSSVKYE